MPQARPPSGKTAARSSPPADGADPGQSHPLYSVDRATVDRLLAAQTPADADLIDAARLLARYRGFPGAFDLQDDLGRAIHLWGLSTDTLQARARALWQGGWRMGATSNGVEPVGSGFDASGEAEA
ncbi:MAG: DUF3288 family protein [Cyanobacteriota bacterium]|nr:DUF3288 family protein [Cyanobacteriota bacterium]